MNNVNNLWQWIQSLKIPTRVKAALMRLAISCKQVYLHIMEHIKTNQGVQLVILALVIAAILSNAGFLFALVGCSIVLLALSLELLRGIRETINDQK